MKERYIALMAKTLTAYTDGHIRDYFARVKAEGLTEHGFPRLTSNIGILISHGIRKDLYPLFSEMMDFCCAEIPRVKAANDFSVREIISCLLELEKTESAPTEKLNEWKDALRSIRPEDCYTVYAKAPNDPVRNWALFTAVSEHMRRYAGLGACEEFIEIQIASQLQWIDENGMYMDHTGTEVHQPIVYDMVPRGLFSMLLSFGYRGRYYREIDEILRKAALHSLKMQSVTGEIPFGGRSNQFLHNEAWLAVIFEYEANRYYCEGNTALAKQFKAATEKAIDLLISWLDKDPIYHIKNRFPTETKYGCEKYAYFDKYMITTASILHDAYLIANDKIEAEPAIDRTPTVFQTSLHFHKLFLRAGGYALEFDTNGDPKYDASGLGRIHREGAPSAICLSLPCSQKPGYTIDRADGIPLSLAPAIRADGAWCFAATGAASYGVKELCTRDDAAFAVLSCDFPTEGSVETRYTVSEDGVDIEVLGDREIAYLLPAFHFDGETYSEITMKESTLTVSYQGWLCRYTVNGRIEDLGRSACNRNGHYRAFLATGKERLKISVEILKSS